MPLVHTEALSLKGGRAARKKTLRVVEFSAPSHLLERSKTYRIYHSNSSTADSVATPFTPSNPNPNPNTNTTTQHHPQHTYSTFSVLRYRGNSRTNRTEPHRTELINQSIDSILLYQFTSILLLGWQVCQLCGDALLELPGRAGPAGEQRGGSGRPVRPRHLAPPRGGAAKELRRGRGRGRGPADSEAGGVRHEVDTTLKLVVDLGSRYSTFAVPQ